MLRHEGYETQGANGDCSVQVWLKQRFECKIKWINVFQLLKIKCTFCCFFPFLIEKNSVELSQNLEKKFKLMGYFYNYYVYSIHCHSVKIRRDRKSRGKEITQLICNYRIGKFEGNTIFSLYMAWSALKVKLDDCFAHK